jgi:hypothetical protein
MPLYFKNVFKGVAGGMAMYFKNVFKEVAGGMAMSKLAA